MDRITAAEVFVQIAERGSMAATADALEMSRAMVTRYLAEMERWAGARLLHRTTRRLSLTPAGEQTLARCRRMLDVAGELAVPPEDEADAVRGLLRMACAQSLAQEVLVAPVAAFLRAHPQAAIDLRIDARPVNLVEDRIDLAIRITNELDPNLIARRLGDCASVVCAAPAYLAAHGTPQRVQDLAVHNCLTYSYFGRSLWQFTDAAGEPASVPVGGNLSANETQVLLAAAIAGAGIAMQPLYAAAGPLARGELVALLPGHVAQPLGIHGIYASRRQMPAVLRAMLDALAAWFADPACWPPALPAVRRSPRRPAGSSTPPARP
ncbi:LysR family transcriptional regulator [Pseudorhodoferax sp. Leaf267]|uniref:LysR family transcriptional regulator n=1 Tax=Pseudorhodoferax sp. Leaf267 TaxID=1736316 RepID=UPI0006F710BC|nr:LysR family transcriptional regulator [Pseudorhodoferax sp. Leaf267]KQP14050.1 LysR family transcriptional regulator [Pseudorhodoferax sp. Leaf267]